MHEELELEIEEPEVEIMEPDVMACFEIKYNNNKPLYCSSKRVFIRIYPTIHNWFCMIATELHLGNFTHYYLTNIVPGDKLNIRYLESSEPLISNITQLSNLTCSSNVFAPKIEYRLGVDVTTKNGDKIRAPFSGSTSYNFLMSSNRFGSTRASVYGCGKEPEEDWNWQFPDLCKNDEIRLEIVETDWMKMGKV